MKIFNDKKKIVKILDPNLIYILAIPYKYNPTESFERSVKIVQFLREKFNVFPFSPIMHTHYYDLMCKKENSDHKDNYYEWDLQVYSHFNTNRMIIFTIDWQDSNGCKNEMAWAIANNIPILFIDEK